MTTTILLSGLAAACTHPSPGSTTTSSSTVTSTIPSTTTSTTTTQVPAALPAAPPCDSQPPGGSGIRPPTIFFGCATSNDYLGAITWVSWTSSGATGTATHAINGCSPDCAQGTYTKFPVEVRLSDPGYLNGMFVFQTITAIPTGAAGQTETTTATGLYGTWGWPSS